MSICFLKQITECARLNAEIACFPFASLHTLINFFNAHNRCKKASSNSSILITVHEMHLIYVCLHFPCSVRFERNIKRGYYELFK